MSKVIIGSAGGKNIGFDLDVLLPTRGLITADSGGGKSWLIRVLLEQLFGKVQTITIDPEGEFATLREKFPFVLVGKGGETPADPRSAALVARRLLELRASAVCDLYEVKPYVRHAWVKAFIEGLLEVPKESRTPCVVVVDEAHMFCPEKGKGESEASGAMIDLSTRGRKRGLCAIWATQNLAKVNKDASGMLQNRLVGPTFEDVNRKRAAEMLGIEPGAATRKFFDEIKLLEPGNFFAFGRAITRERILVHIRDVQTSHPKAFEKHSAPPPPAPEKIKLLLPKLADLPKEAEEKAQTERELRAEITSLRKNLANVGKVAPPKRAHLAPNPAEMKRAIAAAMKPMEAFQQFATRQSKIVAKSLAEFSIQIEKVFSIAIGSLDKIADAAASASPGTSPAVASPTAPPHREPNRPVAMRPAPVAVLPARGAPTMPPAESNGLVSKKADRTILSVLATHGPCSKNKLAVLSGYTADGGGFNNALGRLRTNGFITAVKVEPIQITEAGTDALGPPDGLPEGKELLDYWMKNPTLKQAGREILQVLYDAHPTTLTKEEIAERTPSHYEPTGGGFNNQLGTLRTIGIVEGYGQIRLCEELSQALEAAV
jgi:hypothetical protein